MAEYSIGFVRSLLAAADQLLPETAPTSTEDLLRNKLLGSRKIMPLQVPGSVRIQASWHGA
jgi:hypothetical protein